MSKKERLLVILVAQGTLLLMVLGPWPKAERHRAYYCHWPLPNDGKTMSSPMGVRLPGQSVEYANAHNPHVCSAESAARSPLTDHDRAVVAALD